MPTKILLRDDAGNEAQGDARLRRSIAAEQEFHTRPSLTPPRRIETPRNSRSLSVNFRSALRHDEESISTSHPNDMSTDIRASPRLMGYLSCGLASTVMLVSVMQFFTTDDDQVSVMVFRRMLNETLTNETDTNGGEEEEPEAVFGSTVLHPKLIASVAVAATGVFFNLVILWMHLDTFVCPQVWRKVFCDGSLYERNLLVFMILFWIFGLYVCTSSFSVGEVQANVYFTAWICFASIVMSYRQWRISAGKKTLEDVLVSERETARNWIGTLLCATIAALSVTDMYAFRRNFTFEVNGEVYTITDTEWTRVLAVAWGSVGICIAMVCMIFLWKTPRYPFGPSGCRFDGRFIEGIVLLGLIGLYFWGILEYTETDGPINSPSNAYFATWGAFLFAIATLGTYVKENRALIQDTAARRSSESPRSSQIPESVSQSSKATKSSKHIYTTARDIND